MKIGILGTGMVGEGLGSKLIEKGHEVKMGSRDAKNPKATAWAKKAGAKASIGTFADAAKFGELIINATKGSASVDVLKMAGAANLDGKVVVDVANALDFSNGSPPALTVDVSRDSIAEQLQKAFPKAKIVKTLNTVSVAIMVNPASVPGAHTLFLSGNDPSAKQKVTDLLVKDLDWKKEQILDLGDISTARAQEALIIPWVRLWGMFRSPMFNFQVVRADQK